MMWCVRWPFIGLVSISAVCASGSPPADSDPRFDCGTMALYTILRIAPSGPELRHLSATLAIPPPGGFSMIELRDAARKHGLRLTGVQLNRLDYGFDQPSIVLLKQGEHGHFVVLRPVGHTGKLIQLIDAGGGSEVLDYVDVCKRPDWTGVALVVAKPPWATTILPCIAATAGAVWFARVAARARSRRGRAAPCSPCSGD